MAPSPRVLAAPFLTLALIFTGEFAVVAAASPAPLRYSLLISEASIQHEAGELSARIDILVQVPAGQGFVFVPLPFRDNAHQPLIVRPESDKNLILCGHFQPGRFFGLCAVNLAQEPATIELEFSDARLPLSKERGAKGGYAVSVPLKQACDSIRSALPVEGTLLASLDRVVVDIPGFQDSTPTASRDEMGRRVMLIPSSTAEKESLVVYFSERENVGALYLVLVVLGFFPGVLGAPRAITSRPRALAVLGGSLLALAVLGYIFLIEVPADIRYNDATVVVTIGSGAGLFIGLFVAASRQLLRGRSRAAGASSSAPHRPVTDLPEQTSSPG